MQIIQDIDRLIQRVLSCKRMDAHSLYVHIPFCQKRCAYCDFNTFAGLENTIPAYVNALCREIRLVAASLPYRLPVHTLFFGGGTPSLLSVDQVSAILEAITTVFDVSPHAEISLEANPGTVTREALRGLRRLGVNRLSFGVQSAHPEELTMLTRLHDFSDVIHSVQWAREAGFDNLNLDLMFGLPGQTLERWKRTLELALGLHPEHLSVYCLTIEKGTPFFRWSARGLLDIPDDDLAADMYELAMDLLGEAGYTQYEISNWAKPSGEGALYFCQHNLQYWRGLPYLGMGAGAHGYANGFRTANVKPVPHYLQRCQHGESQPFPRSPATEVFHPVSVQEEMAEMMMVGLRLTEEGVSGEAFQRRFGKSLPEVYHKTIITLEQQGLVEWAGQNHNQLRLTRRGRLLGNRVFSAFL